MECEQSVLQGLTEQERAWVVQTGLARRHNRRREELHRNAFHGMHMQRHALLR